ncbi:MAG: hypothetical protein AAGI44_05825 [Pseudomonadota bacterium]
MHGHFWESRFKSQALYTEEALLACMAYVDLNPVRAGMAETPESSDYTSIQERVSAPNPLLAESLREVLGTLPQKPLLAFADAATNTDVKTIPYTFTDYFELVDWTGRMVRRDKAGFIPDHLPPILQRLHISAADWLTDSSEFERMVHRRYRKQA